MDTLYYKNNHKYVLDETFVVNLKDYAVEININPEFPAMISSVVLFSNGDLEIKKGFLFDGPSGPTIDTENFMRAAFIHDALYRLIRQGKLPFKPWRKRADVLLKKMYLQDTRLLLEKEYGYYINFSESVEKKLKWSWNVVRANYIYSAVRVGGKNSAKPSTDTIAVCRN